MLVTNTAIEDATPASQKILFETGSAPTINSLVIDPIAGEAFDTEFELTMSNYTTDFEEGLKYALYGSSKDDEDELFRLTTEYE